MKIYFENGRTVADYFKHPVIHNILHGNEEMLYDCICNFNGIRLKSKVLYYHTYSRKVLFSISRRKVNLL